MHIINLSKLKVEWRRCETCNVETKSTSWGKHVKSKEYLVNRGDLGAKHVQNIVSSLRELAAPIFKKKLMSPGYKYINQYFLFY